MIRFIFAGPVRLLLWALLLQAGAGVAVAETYTVTITDMNLGVVTSGVTGDTIYRVDPANGNVVKILGTGTRISGGSARSTVTVACAATHPNDCTKAVNVNIQVAGSPTGRARTLTRLLKVMGTATISSSPIGGPGGGGGGSGGFQINAIGANSSKTFFVGADFGIAGDDSGLPTGDAESDFSVFVANAPANPTSGAVGRATARILRSITMTKNSDLIFGRIAIPTSGSGTVSIDATTGARTVTTAVGLSSPTPARAAFTVAGEGGQTFTIAVPATFQLTGPTPPITVTTSNTGGPINMLSAALGSDGTFDLGVGGSFPISSTTTVGDYTGNFTVTVAYN
jgi:hypothetical protein